MQQYSYNNSEDNHVAEEPTRLVIDRESALESYN